MLCLKLQDEGWREPVVAITMADYVSETEAARMFGMGTEEFRYRWERWGRGPLPVATDPRTGERLWVKAMVRLAADARRQGHVL